MVETCRSCGAPIFWARTQKGRSMPVDTEPVTSGNLFLVAGVLVVHVDGEVAPFLDNAEDRPRYTSHFATCPNATAHRKRT